MSASFQGIEVNDYIATVSQRGQDISESFLSPFLAVGAVAAQSIYPALPSMYPGSLAMTLNYVLSAFRHQVTAHEVLDNQMLATVKPNYSMGRSLYMTVKDDQTFLTVEEASHLSFPLGRGLCFDMLMEASTIELAFATTQLEWYANSQKKNGKYENLTVGWNDLHSWYTHFDVLDRLEDDARAALKNGIIEQVSGPRDSFYLHYREASSFHWVP